LLEVSKKITRIVGQTNAKYNLIEDNDKILVGFSGGKDSLTLIHTLKRMQQKAPYDFDFTAVTIRYGMGEDLEFLSKHCKEHDIKHQFIDTQIFDISKEKIRKNSSFCSFVSRMRRGYLYTYALENNFNKLALGHHLDDAMESFFMNMFYNGALRSMPPIYTAKNNLKVIRPLIMCRERQLRDFALKNCIDVVGDESCPAMRVDIKMPYTRANTKELLSKLEQENKQLFVSLKSAFQNIHIDTFFQKEDLRYD
jgi:tRNA(Ile)-lysidine synthetase-like protein